MAKIGRFWGHTNVCIYDNCVCTLAEILKLSFRAIFKVILFFLAVHAVAFGDDIYGIIVRFGRKEFKTIYRNNKKALSQVFCEDAFVFHRTINNIQDKSRQK